MISNTSYMARRTAKLGPVVISGNRSYYGFLACADDAQLDYIYTPLCVELPRIST